MYDTLALRYYKNIKNMSLAIGDHDSVAKRRSLHYITDHNIRNENNKSTSLLHMVRNRNGNML